MNLTDGINTFDANVEVAFQGATLTNQGGRTLVTTGGVSSVQAFVANGTYTVPFQNGLPPALITVYVAGGGGGGGGGLSGTSTATCGGGGR